MKMLASIVLMAGVACGVARADIPPLPRNQPAEEQHSSGTVAAGLALAAALGVGGTLAVKKLREAKDEPKTKEPIPAPAEAK